MQTNKSGILVSIIIGVALVIAAAVLGGKFKNFREGGVITVKGVAEAQYNATVGEWRVSTSVWGATHSEALQKVRQNERHIESFLRSQGFSEKEITKYNVNISQHYESYEDERGRYKTEKKGFDGSLTFYIRTKDLNKINESHAKLQEMESSYEGISAGDPSFYLENLETIKRNLISQATQDAKLRAEEFAKNNGSSVGSLKSASQGTFNISAANALENEDSSSDYYGGYYDSSTIEKKVRLVVTIQYNIEN